MMLLLLFTVSACGPSTPIDVFHTGVSGVEIELVKGNPDEVYEEETFGTVFFLKNSGAYPIDSSNPGYLAVSYDDYFLNLSERKIFNFILEPKSMGNPTGEYQVFEFVFKAKKFLIQRQSVETEIKFNYCYPYSTELTTTVCVDTKVRTVDSTTPVCKLTDYKSSSGQGAPIAITKIEPEMLVVGNSLRPLYRITIENLGQGYTINQTYKDVCADINKAKARESLNVVRVSGKLSSDYELECNPSEVRLNSESQAITRCYVKDEDLKDFNRNSNTYSSVLYLKADYAYVDTYSKELEINRINEVEIKSLDSCGYYEREKNGKCISLCQYCVENPGSNDCKKNMPVEDFAFDASFGCQCSEKKCISLSKDGKCIFGYCKGSSYCCSTDECRDKIDGSPCGDYNVCRDNKCMLNETLCINRFGAQNYTCMDINSCDNNTIKKLQCDKGNDWVCCLPKKN